MPFPRQELLEEEWLIVRNSGEIPEIAFHSALYYLTEDTDGPQLQLHVEERDSLQAAAAERYQEIILRDLCYDNRTLPIYRGVRRAIFNWRRFVAFCERQNASCASQRIITAEAFLVLMNKVMNGDNPTSSSSIFNCSRQELLLFTRELALDESHVASSILESCQQ